MTRPLARAEKPYFVFAPIDELAKSGDYQLLKDDRGHQHAGRWSPSAGDGAGGWVYGSGQPVPHPVTEYCVRAPLGWELA